MFKVEKRHGLTEVQLKWIQMLVCFILKPHLTSVIHPGEGHGCEQETLPYDAQLEAPGILPAHRLILTKE